MEERERVKMMMMMMMMKMMMKLGFRDPWTKLQESDFF